MLLVKKYQALLHGFYYGARCNGRAGKLVKFSAIFFYCPAAFVWVAQAFAVKTQNPVAVAKLALVAEPRSFLVAEGAHAAKGAIGHNADQQLDGAAVAFAGADLQD